MTKNTEPVTELNFPQTVSNSMRSAWVACPRRFYWKYIRGLVPRGKSIDLVFGAAFARGLEVARRTYTDGASPQAALEAGARAAMVEYGDQPVPDNKTIKDPAHLLSALDAYFERWPLDTDPVRIALIEGSPSIEFTFSIELPIPHPQTGQPLLYVGRYDWTGIYQGELRCVDEKTTTRLGPRWGSHWQLDSQFLGYMWAARRAGLQVVGTIVRGIAPRVNGTVDFAEAHISYRQWMIDRWYDNMVESVRQMVEAWRRRDYLHNLATSCSSYSGCPYITLCSARNPEPWVKIEYELDPRRVEASKEVTEC